MVNCFIGVDVGTGSVRAAIFNALGEICGLEQRCELKIWHGENGIVEQSSEDIWTAVCTAVRKVLTCSDENIADIRGMGFTATCSLVVLGDKSQPLTVGPSGQNVVVWMDHRAQDQAVRINNLGHPVLKYVGNQISPEMQTPKILWLKENRRDVFDQASAFFDLADFLSWRATGSEERSLCTLACKWTYLAHERRWDDSYFRTIGLEELADNFKRIGQRVLQPGQPISGGLSTKAAEELGLRPGIAVGASLIDAHSGALGSLYDVESEIALIAGTSACIMKLSTEPNYVPGVWGPYFEAIWPNKWLTEAGQSAFGAAIDYAMKMHPLYESVKKKTDNLLKFLEIEAIRLAGSVEEAALLGESIDLVPEFLGNRSPDADPSTTAIISGLRLDHGTDLNPIINWFVAIQRGLCLGTDEILRVLEPFEPKHSTIVISGGFAKSRLFSQILSDCTGKCVAIPSSPEPVLLGAAIIGAVASGLFTGIGEASEKMIQKHEIFVTPNRSEKVVKFYERKRTAFRLLKECQRNIKALKIKGDTINTG